MTATAKYIVSAKKITISDGDTLDSIAKKGGITKNELLMFNFGTINEAEVNKLLKKRIGCTKLANDGKTFILSSSDKPGIFFIPVKSPAINYSTNQKHTLKLQLPEILTFAEIQTTDVFGNRLGNISLTLKSLKGASDLNVTTNDKGFGKIENIQYGEYKILQDGNKPVYYLKNQKQGSAKANNGKDNPLHYGNLKEAILNTDNASESITRVVIVSEKDKTAIYEKRNINQVYQLPYISWENDPENKRLEPGKRIELNLAAIDNLELAAGFNLSNNVDIDKLTKEILPAWIDDHYPVLKQRGYFILLIEPRVNKMQFINSSGDIEIKDLTLTKLLKAPVGAYSLFEDVAKNIFVDMTFQQFGLSIVDEVDDGWDLKNDVVEKEIFISGLNSHPGEIPVVYFTCTGPQLYELGMLGGSGRLEDYGTNSESVRSSIHRRNINVLERINDIYNNYIDEIYIPSVKKVTSEDELRKLGPPRKYYQMPLPAGANDQELRELYKAMRANEIKPWITVNEKLDDLFGRHSAGNPFIRIKIKTAFKPDKQFEYEKAPLRPDLKKLSQGYTSETSVEFNLDIEKTQDGYRVLTKSKADQKVTLKGDVPVTVITKNGVVVELSEKINLLDPNEKSVVMRMGYLEVEQSNTGKRKLKMKDAIPGFTAESSYDVQSAEMYTGFNFSLKDLVRKASKSKTFKENLMKNYGTDDVEKARNSNTGLNNFLSILENTEIGCGIGFTGTTEETVLALITSSHGFFDRKSANDLCDSSWNKLELWEQTDLFILGWNMDLWDNKYYKDYSNKLPPSLNKDRYTLSDKEKVSIVNLGFRPYEEYGKFLNKKISSASSDR